MTLDDKDYVTMPNGDVKINKIKRYGWIEQDTPGVLKWINKNQLEIDESYQRTHNRDKARGMASKWSWVACGALTVGCRGGIYFVIDGQHRAIAARFRSDIIDLPCIVFNTLDKEEEAAGFLNANTFRRPIRSIDSYKAKLVAKDESAEFVDNILKKYGIVVKKDVTTPKSLHAIGACFRMEKESRADFERTVCLVSELCENSPIHEILFAGMFYLVRNLDTDIEDKRLRRRILLIGSDQLEKAAKKAAAYYVSGGPRVWALGMRDELNKGLRNPFKFKFGEE